MLNLSFAVPAGLLIRQIHHWAADVFIASIVLHLMRIFFTGAYRKPRDFNYYIGLTMLMLAILEGFAGYSLGDDLLSGMGLGDRVLSRRCRFRSSAAQFAYLVFGGPFPGSSTFLPRLEIDPRVPDPGRARGADHDASGDDHAPAPLAVSRPRQARTQRRRHADVARRTPCGRSALLLAVAAILFLIGGLIQINPYGYGGRTTPTSRRTAPSPTGTSGG